MSRKVRQLPEQKNRVETGAIKFGDDWPGLFVRGDDSVSLLLLLEQAYAAGLIQKIDPTYRLIKTIRHDVQGGVLGLFDIGGWAK